MAVKATPQAAAEAWSTNFGAAGAKYAAGIDAVQTAPGTLAAAQKNAYVQGVTNNANIWASKVAAVDLPTWKNAAKTTGSARLASGAQKGAPKMQAFMTGFLPVLSGVVSSLPPRGSFDQNLARFTTYARALNAKKGQF